MYKTFMLVLLLLLSSASLWAQKVSDQQQAKASDPNTIEGCLQSSHGEFTLTDSDGNVHQLSRYANKLAHNVGWEVQITGEPGIRTMDTTPVGGAPSAVEQRVFNVKTVTRLANKCKGMNK